MNISKIEKVKKLLSYLGKDTGDSIFSIRNGKLVEAVWVEHPIDFGGEYQYKEVLSDTKISDKELKYLEKEYINKIKEEEDNKINQRYLSYLYSS